MISYIVALLDGVKIKGISMIFRMFKKLRGDKYAVNSGRNKSVARSNTYKKPFKQRIIETLSMRNWFLKHKSNAFKSPDKPINNFRSIQVEKAENHIKTPEKDKSAATIKVVKQAKDVIPEFLGKTSNLDQSKKFFNPNIGENKQENIAKGSFGVVQHAYAKTQNKRQNMSRLFVKKKLKNTQSNKVFREHQANKTAGIASKLNDSWSSIITEYGGETLKSLFIAEQNNTQTETSEDIINDETTKEMPYNSKEMSFETKIDIAKQLLTEISKLHEKGLIHTDIKAENILVNNKGKLSIIDFGGLADVNSSPNPDSGVVCLRTYSPNLAPPEVSFSPFVNNRYDSWSAGEVIYELFTGKSFLENVHHPETWNEQKRHALTQNIGDNLANNPNLPQEAKTLIYALLAPNPEERVSVTEALQFSLFTNRALYGKPSLIALSTQHDEKFKELARLENELTKTGITELKRQELQAKIKDLGYVLKKLQEEINKF